MPEENENRREMAESAELEPPALKAELFQRILGPDMTEERVNGERALRRSEAFFRSIWEGSSDGMRVTDEDGIILAVNDAFCRMVALPREELVGQPFWTVYETGETPSYILEAYRRRCRNRDFGTRHPARVTLRSGEVRHLDLSLSETEGDGEKSAFLTMFRDITEAKLAEERRLKLERKMLEGQRLESLGVLAGGIAHDFNNLLTAILGNASLTMMQLPVSSPLRPFMEGIEKSSLEAADLCKQMLAYSGHGRLEFRCFSINNLLEEMNHLLHVSLNKQIVVRYNLAPDLPAIKAEASEIQQVIMNLVINASEAIGNRSGAITLSTGLVRADRAYLEETFLAPDLSEGDFVSIEVSDTGCGMTPETQARIFDPFFTTKFTGRGLGLAAVLGILQRHKGALKVYSEPNRGSTLRVLLPAAEMPSDRLQDEVAARQWRARGTVLVVDDEQSVRAVASRMLEKCGLTVLLAKDGSEAVEVFRRHKDELDLVLLDMTMPVMGGEQTFSRIRRLKPEAKVILMSGYAEADATDSFAGRGLSGFIQKPFKCEQLEAKLKEFFGSGRR